MDRLALAFLHLKRMSKQKDATTERPLFAVVDLETTGTLADGKVTEVAIIVTDGEKEIERFSSLVNPERRIDPYVQRLTGITNRLVAESPRFFELAKKIVEITEGKILVAHNSSFDYPFLKQEFSQLGFKYERQTICTVEASRAIIPGHPSYSLGKLCKTIGIEVHDRHRAEGDAAATVELLHILYKENQKALWEHLKDDLPKLKLPPNLEHHYMDQLPDDAGVYYFHGEDNEILYIGKSKHIRKRVLSHFSAKATGRTKQLWKKVHSITTTRTGSELVALLLESAEIKKHQPPINHALKKPFFPAAIVSYTDQNGFLRLAAKGKNKRDKAILEVRTIGAGQQILKRKAEEFKLCHCLLNLEKPSGGKCMMTQIKRCHGAAIGREKPETYNKRSKSAMENLSFNYKNLIIVGRGRAHDEVSIVQIENGKFKGFGYMDKDENMSDPSALETLISVYTDNPDARRIIRTYMARNQSDRVVTY